MHELWEKLNKTPHQDNYKPFCTTVGHIRKCCHCHSTLVQRITSWFPLIFSYFSSWQLHRGEQYGQLDSIYRRTPIPYFCLSTPQLNIGKTIEMQSYLPDSKTKSLNSKNITNRTVGLGLGWLWMAHYCITAEELNGEKILRRKLLYFTVFFLDTWATNANLKIGSSCPQT